MRRLRPQPIALARANESALRYDSGKKMLFLLSIFVLGSCVSALLIKWAYGKLDILEPLVPAVIAMVSLFSVRPLAMLQAGETGSYRWFNIEDTITWSLAICGLGVMSYLAGYFLSARAPAPRARNSQIFFSTKRLHAVALFYVVLSLFLTAAHLGSNPIATLAIASRGRSELINQHTTINSEYLSVAPLLLPCAATLIILGNRKTSITFSKALVIFILIAVPLALFYLTGNRRFMLSALLVPLLAYLLKTGRRPRARHVILLVPCFLIFAAIPFMRAEGAREQIGGIGDQIAYAFTRSDIWEELFLGPDTEMLPAFAVELSVLKEYDDFFYGRAVFGDLVIAPIPSALFPKPVSARDQMLIETVGSRCIEGPCPDFSIIGTFYQDFWIPGVIVGMMVSGFVSRRIWLAYRIQRDNPVRICAAAITTAFTLIIMRAGFMPAFQWSLYFFVPIAAGLYLSRRRSQQQSTSAVVPAT